MSASWRMRLESLMPTVEVTSKAKSATQFCGSATVSVPTGGRKKKLKERIAASDMRNETVIPQTAETAKIASRNESATVVWFTRGRASRKNRVIPATISSASKLRTVRSRTERVIYQFYRTRRWVRE